ncbi:hypothetical protein C0J52_08049 [Blattella germanica]|nr:hypothetical protein C0J52_08049 [Blattella germanica]
MGCGYSSSFVVAEQQTPPTPLPPTPLPPPPPVKQITTTTLVSANSKHPLETRIVQVSLLFYLL